MAFNLPSIEKQREIIAALDPLKRMSEDLVRHAEEMLEKAKMLRYSYMFKYFGFPENLRLNPTILAGLIRLKNGDPNAHFWIMRSGQTHRVGKPFRRDDPEFIPMEDAHEWRDRPKTSRGKRLFEARIPRAGLDPRNHTGVTILRTDLLLPEFLYYVAEYAWQAQIYRRLCTGTLALQHIRHRDIECAFKTVLNQIEKKDKKHRHNPSNYPLTNPSDYDDYLY